MSLCIIHHQSVILLFIFNVETSDLNCYGNLSQISQQIISKMPTGKVKADKTKGNRNPTNFESLKSKRGRKRTKTDDALDAPKSPLPTGSKQRKIDNEKPN